MNNIKTKIILILGVLMFSSSAFSQEETKSSISKFLADGTYNMDHLSFWAGFAAPAISYENSLDMGKSAFALTIGGEYKYSLFKRVTLSAGLEYNYAANDKLYGSITKSSNERDIQGDNFLFRSTVINYKENHVAHNLGIPIKIGYELPASETSNIYFAGGFKFGLPIYSSYDMSFDNLSTSGYYPQWEVVYGSDLPEYGFYNFGKHSGSGRLGLKPYISLLAEVGMTFPLNDNGHKIHVGLYMDYGLNKFSKAGSKQIVKYNSDGTKGVMGNHNMLETGFIKSMRFVNFGLKISYSLPYDKLLKKSKSSEA